MDMLFYWIERFLQSVKCFPFPKLEQPTPKDGIGGTRILNPISTHESSGTILEPLGLTGKRL